MRLLNSSRNFAAIVSSSFFSTALGFIASPFILSWLGSETFGVYRMLFDLFGYFVLLEFGIYEAYLSLISKEQSKTDNLENIRDTLVTGIQAYLKILPLKLFAGVVVIALMPKILHSNSTYLHDAYIAAIFGILNSFFCVFSPLRGLIDSRQEKHKFYFHVAVQGFLITILSLVLAFRGWGISGQFISLFLGGFPISFFLVRETKKICPTFSWREIWRPVKSKRWGILQKRNRVIFVSNLCARISFFSDTLILGYLLGPVQVTAYHFTQKLIVLAQPFLNGVGHSSWGGLMELHWQREYVLFEKNLLQLIRITSILGCCILLPIILCSKFFISLWVGAAQFGGILVVVLASLNLIFVSQMALWSWCFTAKGKTNYLLPQYVVASILNIVFSVVFTKYGNMLAGPLLGTCISTVFVSLTVIPYYLKKFFFVSPWKVYQSIYVPFLWYLPLGIASYLYLDLVVDRWLILALFAMGTGIFSVAYTWLFVLKKEEKEIVQRILKLDRKFR